MRIKDIPRGEYFVTTRISPDETPDVRRVWVRGEYNRSSQKYECYKWEDVNHTHEFDGSKTVYTDFIF